MEWTEEVTWVSGENAPGRGNDIWRACACEASVTEGDGTTGRMTGGEPRELPSERALKKTGFFSV
jgi:hypothetical protein